MSVYVPPRSVPTVAKASPLGPASGILQTEFPLASLFNQRSPQKRMQRAWQLGIEVPWIAAAERVIAGQFTGVPWHLEDENEETLDDKSGGDGAEAYALIAKPQAKLKLGENGEPIPWKRLTRSDLWRLTCRHMGLCGNAFWLLDAMDPFGIPQSIIYIRPDRMTPVETEEGNLIGWLIDKTATSPGIPVTLHETIQFMFQPPDTGHFGIGLVESALLKAGISMGLDRHLGSVIDAGGRLSGIMAPKSGTVEPETAIQMERDWRTVVEQSDPAKRLQIVRAPVDFTPTVMTLQEQQLRDFMTGARDDLLALWGVPTSKLGLHDRGEGLGASAVIGLDDSTLWQNGVHPRLGNQDQGGFVETLQVGLLDRFAQTGSVIELIIEEPTFDDDSPKYDNAAKSISVPLRTVERRAILGLEPLGPEVRNPETGVLLDDEVWMPALMGLSFSAPTDGTKVPPPEPVVTNPENPAAAEAAGETSAGGAVVKASPIETSLLALRKNLDRTFGALTKRRVRDVLDRQKADIAQRLRQHAIAIGLNPKDQTVWWDAKKWDAAMGEALRTPLSGVAQTVNRHVSGIVPRQKAEPKRHSRFVNPEVAGDVGIERTVERVLSRGAARVTGINQTTRDAIQRVILDSVQRGLTANEAADLLEAETTFSDYRSELIARTELMDAMNYASIASYEDAGITHVEASDGDEDQECVDRLAGNPYTVEEAASIEDHPNGTLAWLPVIDYAALRETFAAASLEPSPVSVTIQNPGPLMGTVLDFGPDGMVIGEHPVPYDV